MKFNPGLLFALLSACAGGLSIYFYWVLNERVAYVSVLICVFFLLLNAVFEYGRKYERYETLKKTLDT